jgi:hypothetical protein
VGVLFSRSARLEGAYLATDYVTKIGGRNVVIRPGHRSVEVEKAMGRYKARTAAFITAYNPLVAIGEMWSIERPMPRCFAICVGIASRLLKDMGRVTTSVGRRREASWHLDWAYRPLPSLGVSSVRMQSCLWRLATRPRWFI